MFLYKYAKANRIADLHARKIRFTQLRFLNDYWEGKALVLAVLDREKQTRDFEEMRVGTPAERAAKLGTYFQALGESPADAEERVKLFDWCLAHDPSAVEKFLDDSLEAMWVAATEAQEAHLKPLMVDSIRASVGVLSLTQNPSDNLMWSHYGDEGRGIVFEFDSADPFFTFGLDTGNPLYGLRPVDYMKGRPEIPHMEDEQQTWKRLLFTKPEVWQYEQEWRLPRFLTDGSASASDPDVVLFDLPPTTVTGVILGPRMTQGKQAEIIDSLRIDSDLSHIRILRAKLSETTYDLEIGQVA